MTRPYRYISADSHFESPPELWTHRVPKQYRDRAPRSIKLADGRDALVVEGQPLVYGGTSVFAGIPHEEFNPAVIDFGRAAGVGGPERRLKEQDADGIDAEVLFALGVRNRGVKDKNSFVAIVRGFNDYLAEEYCSVAPDRLIGLAVLPGVGAREDAAEMERCARLGLKGVVLSTFPSGKDWPTPEDDFFWAAAADMDIALNVHTSFPQRVMGREVALFKYPKEPEGEERPPIDIVQRMARHGIHHSGSLGALQIVLAGVFERFPRLQIHWAENNVGWIPYYYEQMDREYQINYRWAERVMGLKPLARLPSEYLREHAYWGFFEDHYGMRHRLEVGVDRIMWSTDFPHEVTRWPHSLKWMEAQLAGVPEEEKYQIVCGNAIKFFRLEQEPPGMAS